MPTPFLGSNTFEVVPTINSTGGPGGGDPLTVSVANNIPSLIGGSGAPSGVPAYGTGSMYFDTTNFVLYQYENSAWYILSGSGVSNAPPTNIVIPADYSYVVVGYLNINNITLSHSGNIRIL